MFKLYHKNKKTPTQMRIFGTQLEPSNQVSIKKKTEETIYLVASY